MDEQGALRAALAQRLDGVHAVPTLRGDSVRRIRSHRLLFGVAAIVSVSLLVAATGLAVAAALGQRRDGASVADHPRTFTSPSPAGSISGWVDHVDLRDQLAIQTPPDWTFQTTGISSLISPSVDFALGTWDFPLGGKCAPTAAINALPSDGMFMYILELGFGQLGPDSSIPPRPDTFNLGPLQGPLECLGTKAHTIEFRDHGRSFQVHVLFGRNASDSLRDQTVEALNSLAVAGGEPSPTPAP